ncbi:MAG: hypothetical protein GF383_01880 [Candidatus Lokiarchaeota archaeon]|nr:hypothetical protein [Candidatus Lokiarchaeota archaeon]
MERRFLLIAFISLAISLLEGPYASIFGEQITFFTLIVIYIFRFFLISSGIEYYFGFFLPEKLENWLIKEEK